MHHHHNPHIFLAGRWKDDEVPGSAIEVPADTLVALFTLQYCQNRAMRVVLVPDRVEGESCVFPVFLRTLCFAVEVRGEGECPVVLCHCELPAVVSQAQEEEEEERKNGREEEEEEECREYGKGELKENEREELKEDEEEEEEEIKENGREKEKEEERENGKEEEEEKKNEEEEKEVKKEEQRENGREKLKEKDGEEEMNKNREEKVTKNKKTKKETENKQGEDEEEKEEDGDKVRNKEKVTERQKTKINKRETKNRQEEKEEEDVGEWREGPWCCAGLCSSLRVAVKEITDTAVVGGITAHHAASLLGFRGGCLQACAEVSVWTKFCEVEAPAALHRAALAPYRDRAEVVFPEEVLRFECHLRRPPILHNALKRTQQHIRETVHDLTQREELCRRPLAQLPALTHQYAEGLDMTLADLMLFACFHLMLTGLEAADVAPKAITPLVTTWHSTLALNSHVREAMAVLEATEALLKAAGGSGMAPRVVVPSVPDVSIYKSDPERGKGGKSGRGVFTRQGDVEEVLRVLEDGEVEAGYISWPPDTPSTSSSFFSSSYEALPLHALLPALSLQGHVPHHRLQRKTQQLENICRAVLALTHPGDVIVDFCSGGGHVGIPLAQCLPQCRVLLVENKTSSLQRARERVRALCLENVVFIQTNLDYFRGGFDVGVSLHACGAATDLVLRKCVARRAAFVVAPCCYGSIRPNHVVSYPRSKAFGDLTLTLDQYITLGHAADQTHDENNPKTEQGQRCMRFVDGDRLAGVREAGYQAALALMHPPTCSPKNHLLLGKPVS